MRLRGRNTACPTCALTSSGTASNDDGGVVLEAGDVGDTGLADGSVMLEAGDIGDAGLADGMKPGVIELGDGEGGRFEYGDGEMSDDEWSDNVPSGDGDINDVSGNGGNGANGGDSCIHDGSGTAIGSLSISSLCHC